MSSRFGHRGPLLLAVAMVYFGQLAGQWSVAAAQDFQIVWVAVGEAEATTGNKPRAGSHLFMASDLMALSMKNVKVARVEVLPAVSRVPAGHRLCVSSLGIKAFDAGGGALKRAPLSISIRQDQKQKLVLERDPSDICFTPTVPGEYPIRFASLLPASDGTMRGAQIFVRVTDANSPVPADASAGAVKPLTGLSALPMHGTVPMLRAH